MLCCASGLLQPFAGRSPALCRQAAFFFASVLSSLHACIHARRHVAWLPLLPVVDFGSRSLLLACFCLTHSLCVFSSALPLTVPQAAVPAEANEGTAGQHRVRRGICRRTTGCLRCCCCRCCHSRSSGGCRQQQAAVHGSILPGEQGPFCPDPCGLG